MVVKRAVDLNTLGAWVIKCNPHKTPVEPMLAAGEAKPTWCVADNYRSRLIQPGQRVLFWVSSHPRRGMWGAGQLHTQVSIPLFSDPLTAITLSAISGLHTMEVFRSPQHSNPSWVSTVELELMEPLLKNRVTL